MNLLRTFCASLPDGLDYKDDQTIYDAYAHACIYVLSHEKYICGAAAIICEIFQNLYQFHTDASAAYIFACIESNFQLKTWKYLEAAPACS